MIGRLPRELPPTAGLPLQASDFLPGSGLLGQRLAAQLRTPPLQLECSGTSALLIALRTLQQLQPQRPVVVVPAYTCPLVAIAVHSLGLQLRLCDLRRDHFDLDPQALAVACDESTLAIIPTHLGGRVADVEQACTIAHRVGAYVIEDAAQALGALDHGQSVGLRGDIGFFSLAAGKGLSIFEGGLLLAREPRLRAALQRNADHHVHRQPGWELRRWMELLGLALCYRPQLLPLVYGRPLRRGLQRNQPEEAVGDVFPLSIPQHRVSRWRGHVGYRAAARLPDFLQRGRERARQLKARLQQIPGIRVLDDAVGQQGVWPVLILQLASQARRDAALQALWGAGVGASRMFIHALPDYAYLQTIVADAPIPNARDFAARTLTLGNSAWLDERAFQIIHHALTAAATD